MTSKRTTALHSKLTALVQECDELCEKQLLDPDECLIGRIAQLMNGVRWACFDAQLKSRKTADTVCDYMVTRRNDIFGMAVPELSQRRRALQQLLNPAEQHTQTETCFPTMTRQQQAVLQALWDYPQEVDRWQVFADMLEDHGDPRAELVRYEAMAAEILPPEHVHGLLSAWRFFGNLPQRILRRILIAPRYSLDVLKECKDHILVLDAGASVNGIRERALENDRERWTKPQYAERGPVFSSDYWYHSEPFARCQRNPAYRLFPSTMFEEFFDLPLEDQQSLLAQKRYSNYEIGTAAETLTVLTLHEQDTGERLLPNYCVRCKDRGPSPGYHDGQSIRVGQFQSDGLVINDRWDHLPYFHMGAALFRKHS